MDEPPIIPRLSSQELRELKFAAQLLEHPGLTARLAGALGRPLTRGLAVLPNSATQVIHKAAHAALTKALTVAIASLGRQRQAKPASERWHKLLVGASGGVGGAFGLAALPIELPLSTAIMLRSIADIARSEGHDVGTPEIQLSCLEVFALGGRQPSDDSVEPGYWGIRAALSSTVAEASTYLSKRVILDPSAPALARLIGTIASRFGIVVSEEVAAKAIPVIGAAGGSLVNVLFMSHFQDMARGHFIVKRLESIHGQAAVRAAYDQFVS